MGFGPGLQIWANLSNGDFDQILYIFTNHMFKKLDYEMGTYLFTRFCCLFQSMHHNISQDKQEGKIFFYK